jgi:predicted mannosyl-3-phosphoglycerate phosphatase (HAD superfamily)
MQIDVRDPSSFPPQHQHSMLILTCVDGALRATTDGSCLEVRDALESLSARGVSTILTSHHDATELMAIQRELGLREPFIAELGRVLYVPRERFNLVAQPARGIGDWDVFEFSPASVADAIETLMWLYRVSGDSPLLVGVGASWSDRSLLRHVDVPVVIPSDRPDHRQLRVHFPHAYVTAASGPGGWREAMLGADALDSAGERQ